MDRLTRLARLEQMAFDACELAFKESRKTGEPPHIGVVKQFAETHKMIMNGLRLAGDSAEDLSPEGRARLALQLRQHAEVIEAGLREQGIGTA
jgi:hypothetical protein